MLTNLQKRFLLFLFGCIGTRTLFAYIAKTSSTKTLLYLGALAIIPAIGFITIYLAGLRRTGAEVFGEQIWWNDLRPVHALFYILFAFFAFQGKRYAWVPLGLDVIIGLVAFLTHHYYANSYSKILPNV